MDSAKQANVWSIVKNPIVILIIILLITVFAFSTSINNDFIYNWDDDAYIVNNEFIKDLSFNGIKKMFTVFYVGNYHPLTALTNAIEYKIFGLNPRAFHFFNLLLHLFNVVLVFYFIYLLTRRIEASVIVAVLFAIHPMHAESVVWISERKDVLYAFFYLGSLIAYLSPPLTPPEGRGKNFLLSLFLFLFSLLSKASAITLPLVLLLLDFHLNRKLTRKSIMEKIPFFILSIIFGITAYFSQKLSGTMDLGHTYAFIDKIFLSSYALCFYIFKLILPINLSAIYFFPEKINGWLPLQYYLSLPVIVFFVFSIYKWGRRNKNLVFGLLFFLSTIILVLQIITFGNSIVSERYTYLPYLGLFFIAGQFYCKIADGEISHSKKIKSFLDILLPAAVICFSMLTFQRNLVWKNGVTLATDVIEKNPFSHDAYLARGVAKGNINDHRGAIADFTTALGINSRIPDGYNNRGLAKGKINDYAGAITDFSEAIRLHPEFASAYNNRGFARGMMQDYSGALADFSEAIRMNPDYTEAFINRGNANAFLQKYEDAIRDFTTAIRLKPGFAPAYYNRAMAKFQSGKIAQACEDWQVAAQMKISKADEMLQKYCQ